MKNFRPKEISWLAFNERVLQEATKANVPLIERFRFLGIYSNNLDEFFRVRVATLKRISEFGKNFEDLLGDDPKVIHKAVNDIVLSQRIKYEEIHNKLNKELAKQGIHIINESQISDHHRHFIIQYFYKKVRPKLMPIMIDQVNKFPELDDDAIYLATILSKADRDRKRYALIKIPTDELSRFLILPRQSNKKFIIFLDDVIRLGLSDLFHIQKFDNTEAYTIKVTKDAELDIDDDLGESFVSKVAKSLKKREEGVPVRLVYDYRIPEFFLMFLKKRMGLGESDALIPGGRYHNLKDFIKMPNLGSEKLIYPDLPVIQHPAFRRNESIFDKIRKRDILLHFPYHSFDHFIDLLREASIDPKVSGIRITLYRLANYSSVISALLSALKNGKRVMAVVELTARFNEQSNIEYSEQLREEGARVIYGVPGLKVHAKLCQITRREKGVDTLYSLVGTGNFNEDTGKVFSDILLFTNNFEIGQDVSKLFDFFKRNYRVSNYNLLMPSPFAFRFQFTALVKQEIENAKKGKKAYIHLKLNNLVDQEIIDLLLIASRSGVEVRLNIRGMYSLIQPDDPDYNIEAIGIIDRFLEHTRIFYFCNDGEEKIFFSSADLMTRNLDRRVEVTCPVLDPGIKQQLRDFFDIQWKDNTQARILDKDLKNVHRPTAGEPFRSQIEFHDYLIKKAQA
jgi:polyphosphate kinase